MLNIFINTWGNYNENGANGGKWLTLPMDDDKLADELEKIAAAMGDDDPEWCIHDYEWTGDIDGEAISEYANIETLNERCQALDELSEYERKVYSAVVECWGGYYADVDDLDDYTLNESIEDEYDLGYYWAVESGCYELEKMGSLANYIDYRAFGRDIAMEADGGFTSYGFIERC